MASVYKREWTNSKGEKKSAWAVRWLEAGKHESKGGFNLKKEAEKFRREVETRLADGEAGKARPELTVREACEAFIRLGEDKTRDGRMGNHHLRSIKFAIDRSIIPHLGKIKLSELTVVRLEEFYRAMVRADDLAPSTGRMRIAMLALVEEFAAKRGWAAKSVAREALKELRGIKAATVRTFTVEDVHRLIRCVDTPFRFQRAPQRLFRQAVVYVATHCGLRYGEIVGLTVDNVDFERGVIKVRHSLSVYDGLKGPKTAAGIRDVPMPDRVSSILRRVLNEYHTPNPLNLLFQRGPNAPMGGSCFHVNHWKPLLKRAGMYDREDPFHFHALRHFAASWWIRCGLSLTEVASLMGHRSFDTTLQVYAHPIAGGHDRTEAMNRMADRLAQPFLPISVTYDGQDALAP